MPATDGSTILMQVQGVQALASVLLSEREALKGFHPLAGELGPLQTSYRCSMVNAAADVGITSLLLHRTPRHPSLSHTAPRRLPRARPPNDQEPTHPGAPRPAHHPDKAKGTRQLAHPPAPAVS